MRATGIVRRIDSLGRVVVPKEIRSILRIREGDPLEIYTEHEGEIILKKYSPISEIGEFAKQYAESLGNHSRHSIIITDRDRVIAVSGLEKEMVGRELSKEFENILENRILVREDTKKIKITKDGEISRAKVIQPILCLGDVIGAVILFGSDDFSSITEEDVRLVKIAADFLGKQMEV